MADFLSAYSIQQWLESAPQGYLMQTEYGHPEGRAGARPRRERPTAERAGDSDDGAAGGGRTLRPRGLLGLDQRAGDEGGLHLLDLQSGERRDWLTGDLIVTGGFSPDGQWIVLIEGSSGQPGVFLSPIDDPSKRFAVSRDPAFSAMFSRRGPGRELEELSTDRSPRKTGEKGAFIGTRWSKSRPFSHR